MSSLPQSRFTKPALIVWCLALVIVLIARILGPSDLGQNLDQSKTIAFTLDMVNNNHWILPRDGLGELTRKPPMVNWLGAPIVALGFHNELALKLPAVLSGITTSILVFFAARFLFRRLDTDSDTDPADPADRSIATHATPLAMLAAAAWLASPSAVKHIYFMRPDILFTALLTGAWLASVVLLTSQHPKHPRRLALLIWILTAAAILTKGPLAIFVPVYLILHILIITPKGQRKAALARTHWQWGIPLVLVLPGLWLYSADRINPEHVRNVLLGHELSNRVGSGGLPGFIEALTRNPGFFIERFIPWCIPAIIAMIFPPSSKLRTHPLAPPTLWIIVVLATTTLFTMRAGSYIMPAYPAAAILAVYALYRIIASKRATRPCLAFVLIGSTVLISASIITLRETTMSRGARDRTGENIKAFAHAASQRVGDDDIQFVEIGDLPIASLLGRHQSDAIESDTAITWLVQPTDINPAATPILTSAPLTTHDPTTGEPIDSTTTIGLYRVPD
jgi:4-amino-4-deoxy-L-arabinose transferase-like glycosyltransferase